MPRHSGKWPGLPPEWAASKPLENFLTFGPAVPFTDLRRFPPQVPDSISVATRRVRTRRRGSGGPAGELAGQGRHPARGRGSTRGGEGAAGDDASSRGRCPTRPRRTGRACPDRCRL
ncbi:hypothetical protein RGQ21_51620 [Kitasatospora aureofaciens]|nr:hypothetical protein RGQ21_51620 [Kitasatospora aureofaciens]